MDDDKKKASGSTTAASEVVIEPTWFEKKQIDESDKSSFTVSFNKDTNVISLTVNGDQYRSYKCKDNLSGSIKFHDSMDAILRKFSDWKFYGTN